MVDQAERIYAALFSCASEENPASPPIASFLHHFSCWAGGPELKSDDPQCRSELVFWYLEAFYKSRAPYQPPLPPVLVEWLNQPDIDLSAAIRTYPTLHGRAPSANLKYLTRFMTHIWLKHGKHLDINDERDFYRFLAWYALELIPASNVPTCLLPQPLIDLLNLPVTNESVPMTLSMLANEQNKRGDVDLSDTTRPQLFAFCFNAFRDLLQARDVRLIPPFVSSFWSQWATSEGGLTTFEYVAAKAWGPLQNQQSSLTEVRHWFTSSFAFRYPGTELMGGVSLDDYPSGSADALTVHPAETAIVVYRDHKTICGLSKAGAAASAGLKHAGYHVIDADYALPRNRMDDEYKYNSSLLCNARRKLHLVTVNPEYTPECLSLHLDRIGPRDYVIGQFYWELSDIGRIHELGLTIVDEIWVASNFLVDVYSQHTSRPVFSMGQAVEDHPAGPVTRQRFGLSDSNFLFLVHFDAGSSIERKNPLAALRAFRRAFPEHNEPAGLVIKTRNASVVSQKHDVSHWNQVLQEAASDPRIRIIDATFNEDDIAGLIATCDCYVSLHRSEGFGYGVAEAMIKGKPVIVTHYSSVTDFCDSENSLPVPYELTPVAQGMYPYMDDHRIYRWASPNEEAAAQAMRRVFEDPALGRELGGKARATITSKYSINAMSRRYKARLTELGFPVSSSVRVMATLGDR